MAPGILLKAKKPKDWVPTNLEDIALYSVLLGRRTKKIIGIENAPFVKRLMFKFLGSEAQLRIKALILLKRALLEWIP